jgi:hypothetical protein
MPVKIPDFDDMLKVAQTIRSLTAKKLLLDTEIKFNEAAIVKVVNTDSKYFINGKPPSMSFIESTYTYTGLSDELIPMRKELASIIAELEEAKLRFDIYRMQVDMYRTEAANQRATSL